MSSLIPAGGAQVAGTVILGMIVPAGKGRVGAVASSGMHTDPMEEGYLERFMGLAIDQARLASQHHDVPVGAVIIRAGEVIATGHNRREVDQDPTAHAEILALRGAAVALGNWHLEGCQLIVTLEPCAMCAGAIVLSRLDRLIYGASDPKAGAVVSALRLLDDPSVNHRPEVVSGVRAAQCGALLTDFFADRRAGIAPGRPRPDQLRGSR